MCMLHFLLVLHVNVSFLNLEVFISSYILLQFMKNIITIKKDLYDLKMVFRRFDYNKFSKNLYGRGVTI